MESQTTSRAVLSSPIDELNRLGFWVNIFQQPPLWFLSAYNLSRRAQSRYYVSGQGTSVYAAAQIALEKARQTVDTAHPLRIHGELLKREISRDRHRPTSDDLI